MSQEQWATIDHYLGRLYAPPDAALEAALQASAAAGLPAIQVSANQGKLLHVLAKTVHARNILEIGTLGGYSTIWLARALSPDGRLITLEVKAKHAEVATANISRAGLADKVELRLGPALETLPKLVAEKRGPFDLIFIDADKACYPDYFHWSIQLARRGSLIVADNIIRKGTVVDASRDDPDIQGIRRFNELFAADRRLCAAAFQTVGSKGYDALAIAVVMGET